MRRLPGGLGGALVSASALPAGACLIYVVRPSKENPDALDLSFHSDEHSQRLQRVYSSLAPFFTKDATATADLCHSLLQLSSLRTFWSQNFEYLSILNLSSNNCKLCQICLTKFNQLSAYNKKSLITNQGKITIRHNKQGQNCMGIYVLLYKI